MTKNYPFVSKKMVILGRIFLKPKKWTTKEIFRGLIFCKNLCTLAKIQHLMDKYWGVGSVFFMKRYSNILLILQSTF